jgi:hypothetical protein
MVCQRDEYPPAHFMRGKNGGELVDGTSTPVWIRYLPQDENGGAGRLWRNMCRAPKITTSTPLTAESYFNANGDKFCFSKSCNSKQYLVF